MTNTYTAAAEKIHIMAPKNNYSTTASNEAGIDWSVLDSLSVLQRPGTPDLRARLLTVFLQSSPELMDGIRTSVRLGDGQSLAKSAHSLKSSCFNMGATGLGSSCADLERAGKTGSVQSAEELLKLAEEQYVVVVASFEEALRRFGS